eukprot:CAMPEP_0202882210 /NCGR_PEP_ID=MMETSP1391-20130828/37685_1 /ASSEMBLY_ACC=CAM_ASM_000867 /TAXON_ID=1034604 /ORGANISM="Chlamydomonas leiostraca, Strain SAG 11-49" /LENGTH=38 /DNA_ID= /DNA_START= /DNA_END= /DNA_ORIENTATION=
MYTPTLPASSGLLMDLAYCALITLPRFCSCAAPAAAPA